MVCMLGALAVVFHCFTAHLFEAGSSNSITPHVFDKRILNKGLGTIFQSLLVGIKVAFRETNWRIFSYWVWFILQLHCQALNPESTSWQSFDSPIHRKLVKNLHRKKAERHQKVSVKSVATPWEHTSSRYRTSTKIVSCKPTKTTYLHVELSKIACLVKISWKATSNRPTVKREKKSLQRT